MSGSQSSSMGGRVEIGPRDDAQHIPPLQVEDDAVMCELDDVNMEEAMRFLAPKLGPRGELLPEERDSMSSVDASEHGGAVGADDHDLPIAQRVSRAIRRLKEMEASLPGRKEEQRGNAASGSARLNIEISREDVAETGDPDGENAKNPDMHVHKDDE